MDYERNWIKWCRKILIAARLKGKILDINQKILWYLLVLMVMMAIWDYLTKMANTTRFDSCHRHKIRTDQDHCRYSFDIICLPRWGHRCQPKIQNQVNHESVKGRKNLNRLPRRPFEEESTVSSYQSVIDQFCQDFGDVEIRQFCSDEILSFLNAVSDGNKPLSKQCPLCTPAVIFQFRPQWYRAKFRQPLW